MYYYPSTSMNIVDYFLSKRKNFVCKKKKKHNRGSGVQKEIKKFEMNDEVVYCHYCDINLTKNLNLATYDHIIPLSKGGPDVEENRVFSCVPCNNKKDDRAYEEFVEEIKLIKEYSK